MLRELSDVRQIEGGRPRRWFQSGDEDLIVWYAEDGSIYGFQLCYDRQGRERALTWTPGGFSHNRIDAGERRGFRYKRTPLLVADGRFDASAMTRRFLEISAALPPEIREFVSGKLAEHPRGMQSTEPGVREFRSASEAPLGRAPQRDTLRDGSLMTVFRAQPFHFRASLLLLATAELVFAGWFAYRTINESALFAIHAALLFICALGVIRMVQWARRVSIIVLWLVIIVALGSISPFHLGDLMAEGIEPPSTTRLLLLYLPPCALALWLLHELAKFKGAFRKTWL